MDEQHVPLDREWTLAIVAISIPIVVLLSLTSYCNKDKDAPNLNSYFCNVIVPMRDHCEYAGNSYETCKERTETWARNHLKPKQKAAGYFPNDCVTRTKDLEW